MSHVETLAPAKINLRLGVLARRSDGYHELDTLFQEIDLTDHLRWQPGDAPLVISMSGHGKNLQSTDNLCWQVGKLYAELEGIEIGGRLWIEKGIPLGGGLGGGSSDAVAFLRLLREVHGQTSPDSVWQKALLKLGSDLPFFFSGGCQRGLGRGEQLEPFAPPEHVPRQGHLFLPPISLSTAAVFRLVQPQDFMNFGNEIYGNDLLPAAFRLSPEFAQIFKALRPLCPGPFFMTGSGSSCVWLHQPGTLPSPQILQMCDASQVAVVPFAFSGRKSM